MAKRRFNRDDEFEDTYFDKENLYYADTYSWNDRITQAYLEGRDVSRVKWWHEIDEKYKHLEE